MKPLKLIIQAFGPYPKREVVDFEELSKADIFLIKGPTGSGKTTIFDAMSMALYGKSTGEEDKVKGGRNNLEIWRCNQADWSTETLVEFTFEARGRKYQFIRRLIPKKTKLDPVYAVNVTDDNGDFVAIDDCKKDSELNAKAEEIIGLNSNQFRQVVLLPQGKFERFLTADATEKEQILSRLFDASKWDEYARRLFEKVDKMKQGLIAEKGEIQYLLDDGGFESVEALYSYVEGLKTELEKLEAEHIKFDAKTKKEQLDEDKKLAEKFKRMDELEVAKNNLETEKELIVSKEKQLTNAKKADKVKDNVSRVEELGRDYEAREKVINDIKSTLPELEAEEKESKKNLDDHKAESPVGTYNTQIGQLQSKRPVYENIDRLSDDVATTQKAFEKVQGTYTDKENEANQQKVKALEKLSEYNKADEYARDCRNRYYADIYGKIAEDLSEGEACPVCGSTSHPLPAKKSDDSITKEIVDKAESDAELSKTSWEKVEKLRSEAEKELQDCKNLLDDANNKCREAKTRYEEASKSLVDGIKSSAELMNKINSLQDAIKKYEVKTTELEAIYAKKHDELKSQIDKLSMLTNENNKVKAELETETVLLNKTLAENGYADVDAFKKDYLSQEDKDTIFASITNYNARVNANNMEIAKQQQLLEGLNRPKEEDFAKRQQEIEDEASNYAKTNVSLSKEIERFGSRWKELSKKQKHYSENIDRVESDLAFARRLRGDTGIGLQRYVLGIMFNQIISEANRMLELVHSGRYYLIRTDDKGSGNKRGLELLVHDNRNADEKGRPVSSLSGGEKFLVSLSLSIGMSAIALKSGLQIEALFIDEGFGTLDSSSISDAMEILKCVQKNNGMIGIISHVSLLEENISKHLEIIKKESGSSIAMC